MKENTKIIQIHFESSNSSLHKGMTFRQTVSQGMELLTNWLISVSYCPILHRVIGVKAGV